MKPRDLTDKRLRELADAADGAGQCSVFAADRSGRPWPAAGWSWACTLRGT